MSYTYELHGDSGEDEIWGDFGTAGSALIEAVDGEHDTIQCSDVGHESVRADPLDTFEQSELGGGASSGPQHCDSLTIVE